MAITKITYSDKVDLNENTSIANINKVTASDMNEIKSVANNNATNIGDITSLETSDKTNIVTAINEINTKQNYSTTEQEIGTWIDGKTIYRKAFYISSFPNNTTTTMTHGLSVSSFTKISGIATDDSTVWVDPQAGSANGRMTITVNRTSIYLYANTDRSSLHGYIILEYTK